MTLRSDLLEFVKSSLLRDEREVGPSDSLIDMGVIDSIGLMSLIAFVEERTGIRVPDKDVTPGNFETVEAIEELLTALENR